MTVEREEPQFGNGWVASCDCCFSETSIRDKSINLFMLAAGGVEAKLSGGVALTKSIDFASGKVPQGETSHESGYRLGVMDAIRNESLESIFLSNSSELTVSISAMKAQGAHIGAVLNARKGANSN